jgi:CTP synthase
MKYLIVTGGVVSGLGKGITASSIGMLLKAHGFSVTAIKIDPYVNVDAGTMSPFEHGEVYVLNDGSETDLDLGNYERFLGVNLQSDNNLTTGKVYQEVINKERKGEYLGKTVQVVPHITDHIQEHIKRVAQIPVTEDGKTPDVCIIELGGTIGDIESLPFLEALAQFKQDLPQEDYCFVHVSLIPTVSGELKTKPTQHTIKSAKSYGLVPNILCLRCDKPVTDELQTKLRRTCHLPLETAIITNHNVDSIYKVPDLFRQQKLDSVIIERFKLVPPQECDLTNYYAILKQINDETLPQLNLAIVGKYTGMSDAYLSLFRALEHAVFSLNLRLNITWINAESLENKSPESLDLIFASLDGILVPGGFGDRGIEGMIIASKYAREHEVPYLGICLGMQVMLIEIARNLMGWEDANSSEFDSETLYPIIRRPRKFETQLGATMRLGLFDVKLCPNSIGSSYNDNNVTQERHRHRYEVKNKLFRRMLGKGIVNLGGESDDTVNPVVEIVESPVKGQYWTGCQFHPEYKSRNDNPHWIFVSFIKAINEKKKKELENVQK